MPAYNTYIISSGKEWRKKVMARARQAREIGDEELFRALLRNAVILSYRSRIAKRWLRLGYALDSTRTTEADREALDLHFEKHRRLLDVEPHDQQ